MNLPFWVSTVAFCCDAAATKDSSCRGTSFKQDAMKFATVKYKETPRRGIDYSKIEVECRPFSMVENHECIEQNELKLEFNNDGADANWQKTKEVVRPVDQHGKYKWTVDATPCKPYYFKLGVGGKGGLASLILNDTVKVVPLQNLTANGYEPSKPKPTSFQFETTSENVTVNWTESCSEFIEIIYWPTSRDDANKTEQEPSSNGSTVLSRGIESCSSYSYEVYAVVGEQASEPLEGTFLTAPKENSTFTDKPKVDTSLNSMTVAWNAWNQLPCIKQYKLTVCEVGGPCLTQVLEKGNLPKISHTINSLKECTKYTISLLPLYKDVKMKPLKQDVVTTSHAELIPKLVDIGDGQVSISWAPIHCADNYLVYHYFGDPWSWNQTKTKETTYTLKEIPCVRNSYGVAYTMDGKPSELVELYLPENDNQVQIPADSFNATVMPSGNVSFSWAPVPCAENYVISWSDGFVVATIDTSAEIEVSPCKEYSFTLKAVVGSEEFAMGEHKVKYEPQNLNVTYSPVGINVMWDVPDCVLGFAIRVLNQDNVLNQFKVWNDTFTENKISVSLDRQDLCNSSVLQLGVSPIISSLEKENDVLNETIIAIIEGNCSATESSDSVKSNLYVIPILIAVFVFLGAFVVILVFVIKKRRNTRIYDTENGKIIKAYPHLSRSVEEFEMDKTEI